MWINNVARTDMKIAVSAHLSDTSVKLIVLKEIFFKNGKNSTKKRTA